MTRPGGRLGSHLGGATVGSASVTRARVSLEQPPPTFAMLSDFVAITNATRRQGSRAKASSKDSKYPFRGTLPHASVGCDFQIGHNPEFRDMCCPEAA